MNWFQNLYVCGALCIGFIVALQSLLAREIHHVVEHETQYFLNGVIPPYAPSKYLYTPEVTWEIEGFQAYAQALSSASSL